MFHFNFGSDRAFVRFEQREHSLPGGVLEEPDEPGSARTGSSTSHRFTAEVYDS